MARTFNDLLTGKLQDGAETVPAPFPAPQLFWATRYHWFDLVNGRDDP